MAMLCPGAAAALAAPAAVRLSARRAQAGAGPRAVVVCSSAAPEPPRAASRRAVLAWTAAMPALAATLPALALIPGIDDDDIELLEKAKANKSKRLADDQASLRAEGRVQNVASLKVAVRKLSQAGAALAAGDAAAKLKLPEVLGSAEDPWVKEAARAISELGASKPGAAKLGDAFLAGLRDLQVSAKAGDAAAAKLDYLSTVAGLEYFARKVGIAGDLKGL